MAITNFDQATAALGRTGPISIAKSPIAITPVAGEHYSLWRAAGSPGAGAFPANGSQEIPTGGVTVGSFPFVNPTGGALSYLGRVLGAASQVGNLIVFDRVWHGSFAGNAVAVTTFPVPSGTFRLDAGQGAELWVEYGNATTNGTGNGAISYTTETGALGHQTNFTFPQSNNGTTRTDVMWRIPLQAADKGVRRVEFINLLATTGAASLTLSMMRRIATIPLGQATVGVLQNLLTAGMPKLLDSSCLCFAFQGTTTTFPTVLGEATVIQG